MNRIVLPISLLLLFVAALTFSAQADDTGGLGDPYDTQFVLATAATDTIPPPQERYEDFINGKANNPFDLKDPSAVEQNIEFDPETGQYILTEKVGESYFRPPTYMTFDEYLEYRKKKEEQDYFNRLAGINTDGTGLSATDPFAKFDVKNSIIDRLFGGTTVDIRPQGGIDLTFGFDVQRLDNPILTERQRTTGGFDFDMDIQMNVTGKIGEKLNLNTNYNTSATFDFDNQIKLDYNSDAFSEDDILKKIEAGNVSLPLRGTLIQGAQSLFGLKTELQFGHLRLTAIASQQKSQRENLQLQGGAQLQEFEVKSDEYDENRHFFLSHYNLGAFEPALQNLPQINTLFQIENIEVWITNDRNEVEDVRDIVAFADLGEPEIVVNRDAVPTFQTPRYREICDGKPLPDNGANGLYSRLIGREDGIRNIDRSVAILQSAEFGMQQARDFEKVSARKLNSREYTIHPELGFISLNINVQPDQVLAVSFSYKYNGETFFVGEFANLYDNTSTDTLKQTPQVLFTKMLKSTTQRIDVVTWDLMMKNIYSIGAYQVNPQDFRLDVFYEDPGEGIKRFLPSSNLAGRPLIDVFNLDNLNTQGDPQPDGIFDYVPGLTIFPNNGRIMFPVLEPFGKHLREQLDSDASIAQFTYPELYTQTLFQAREYPEKNRYSIRGSYKSSVSSELSLGAFNVPEGSVRVTAGGALLQEGRDYEVDYATGKVRVLNDAILSSGVPINVSYEDNTLFGFQSKTMLGLRADYEFNKNFNIGATFLQLFERPFTQKVNLGEDPINNKIYGLDVNFSKELPGLTKAIDALPLLSTNAPSNITFSAEAAYLKPGHSRAINESRQDKDGIVYVDDFEGSASSFDLRQPVNRWFLASVPQNDAQNNNPLFPESREPGIESGANRARFNWYRIDPSARAGTDGGSTYFDRVPQQEVFPNIQPTPADPQLFQTLDLAFFPQERGPYNFDIPNGGYGNLTRGVTSQNDSLILNDPETRWGGIMRDLTTNDFQSANIEFLEFWALSPFLDNDDASLPADDVEDRQGTLYINLGNISEDILKDSRKFFENGLPTSQNPERPVDTTVWSRVPIGQQITRAFDNDPGTREIQDVGLDGLDNEGERELFANYLTSLQAFNPIVASRVAQDPSNDDFRYYNDPSFDNNDGISQRYRGFNNPEGNSRSNDNNRIRQSGTNIPDAEDLNQDNTLNETESYFQYEIPLRYNPLNPREIDRERTPFVTDQIEDDASNRIWYRFRIPLSTPLKKSIGGIQDFRSIRFMRMYMHGFKKPVVMRFARLELVRNQWRRYTQDLTSSGVLGTGCDDVETTFDVDAVNIEENSRRTPFNYVLPEGIQRELSLGVFNTLQNEQSLSMRLDNLCDGDSRAIFKIIEWDFRLYDELKMFVHAESKNFEVPDGELKLFIRLGSDFKNNYYEYEIPLVMSDPDRIMTLTPGSPEYKQEVWRIENELNFRLRLLTELKEERNSTGGSAADEYIQTLDSDHVIKVKGNPNLGFVKMAMLGIRNPKNDGVSYSTELWANEMRVVGLDERGGAAALARADIQLADFGNVTVAGNFNSIGFGALDAGVHQRSREQVTGFDIATNLELGKLLPEKLGISVPMYAQISNTTKTPEYDPYDLDLLLDEKVNNAENDQVRDSIKTQAQEVTQIQTLNFTNVRKERTGDSKPMPWDISNFSFSYSQSQIEYRDPIIESQKEKKYTGIIDYSYSRGGGFLEPFKGINSKFLRLIKEININPLPNSFNFSSILDRQFADTRYRFAGDPRYTTYFNKRFNWERNYDLQWNITKSLQLSFNARSFSVIDEPDERVIREDPSITDINKFRRDSILTNLRNLGRPKNYDHSINASYTLPLRYLPFMDWVQVRAQYQAGYSWNAAALNVDSLGNIIQNNQVRQITGDLNFEKLYDSVPYLKKISRGKQPARGRTTNPRRTPPRRPNADDGKKKKKEREPSIAERILIRPLLLIRKARLSYKETFATVVPGFIPEADLLGLSSGFDAPGLGFAFGDQPNIRNLSDDVRNNPRVGAGDWLYDNRSWITDNVFMNQDVVQEYSQEYGGRLTLEPFRDFRIDLDADRKFTENYSESFKVFEKVAGADYRHAIPTYLGSMTVSYNALNTLFRSDAEVLELFKNFESNRVIISQRLGTGRHEDENLASQGYTDGYGRNQQEVLIPAFIATYKGQDPRTFNMNLFDTKPFPNWRASYNGLSKLPIFKDIFTNFNITHGYQSTLTVNNYQTNLYYLDGLQDNNLKDSVNYNFYAKLEIPDVVIQEGFAPLLGIEATLVNGMSLGFDYQQQRTLALNVTNTLLSETRSKKIDFNFGYLMRNVDIPFLTGSKKKGAKKKDADAPATTTPNNNRGGNRPSQLQGQDLDIQFTFSLSDDLTLAQKLDAGFSEPTRGNNILQFSPSAEYKLNQRLSLRLFFDYRRTIPKTSAGFPRLDTSGGIVVRFQLN